MPEESPDTIEELTVNESARNMGSLSLHYAGVPILESANLSHAAAEQYFDDIEKRRTLILELPNQTEGLNLGRVNSYLEEAGIPISEMRFLSPKDYKQALLIAGYNEPSSVDSYGRFLDRLGISVINRDPDMEELNGAEWTEANAVHESAHAETESKVKLQYKRKISGKPAISSQRQQSGFVNQVSANPIIEYGVALEEGIAEYHRGQYVLSLGRKNGFVVGPNEDFSHTLPQSLPGHYWSLRRNEAGKPIPTYGPGSFTGATFEALIQRDPGLLSELRYGRHMGTYDGIKQHMDALSSGLFDTLNHVQNLNSLESSLVVAALYRSALANGNYAYAGMETE